MSASPKLENIRHVCSKGRLVYSSGTVIVPFFEILFLILIYSFVSISAVQYSDPAIYLYLYVNIDISIYRFFFSIFHHVIIAGKVQKIASITRY